jgi:hypothetical protein
MPAQQSTSSRSGCRPSCDCPRPPGERLGIGAATAASSRTRMPYRAYRWPRSSMNWGRARASLARTQTTWLGGSYLRVRGGTLPEAQRNSAATAIDQNTTARTAGPIYRPPNAAQSGESRRPRVGDADRPARADCRRGQPDWAMGAVRTRRPGSAGLVRGRRPAYRATRAGAHAPTSTFSSSRGGVSARRHRIRAAHRLR